MAVTINASTSAGLVTSADTSGDLNIQSGGSTKIAVTSAGANIVGTLTVNGVAPASGKVLQVVTLTGAANTSTSSSTFIDTNLTLNITPTSATSKILCFYSASVDQLVGALGVKDAPMQLLRNSTVLVSSNPYFNTLTEAITTSGNNYLDSPATTSATTYKIQVKCNNSSSVLVYGSTYSSLTLMEIAA